MPDKEEKITKHKDSRKISIRVHKSFKSKYSGEVQVREESFRNNKNNIDDYLSRKTNKVYIDKAGERNLELTC